MGVSPNTMINELFSVFSIIKRLMEEEKEVRKAILKKLCRHRYIGGRHTEIRNAIKGFSQESIKDARREISNLIKENVLLTKSSTGEIHVSLNSRMLKEILRIIQD